MILETENLKHGNHILSQRQKNEDQYNHWVNVLRAAGGCTAREYFYYVLTISLRAAKSSSVGLRL